MLSWMALRQMLNWHKESAMSKTSNDVVNIVCAPWPGWLPASRGGQSRRGLSSERDRFSLLEDDFGEPVDVV